jgi:hypothetical protein
MVQKSRSYLPELVLGEKRTSAFVPWVPYSSIGPLSTEGYTGSTNGWNGHSWTGGGAWYLNRSIHSFEPSSVYVDTFNFAGTPTGKGTTRIENPTSSVPTLSIPTRPSDAQLDADGSTAIARTEPTAPAFDLSVFLGELMREGIPNAPGSTTLEKTRLAKKAGGEYLNAEFGWVPLVRGVEDFSKTVQNADEILRTYQEQSNSLIKRSYEWPPIKDSRFDSCNFGSAGARGFFTGGGRYQEVEQRKWFEAAYTYHLPVGSGNDEKIRRFGSYARKLLGVDLSPEVLWNLAPWSWAVDWFSNVGDVIHNVSAMGQDGMVIKYGYIMCHTRRMTVDTGTLGGSEFQTHVKIEEWKTRRPSTPFGFGVSFSSLSAKQIAIISALGLSRW